MGYPNAAKFTLEKIAPYLKFTDQHVFLGQKDGLWYVGIDISTVDEVDINKGLPQDSFFRDLREVFEEANIEVEDVSYHSSQPWPFPSSIMLGFYARARSTEILCL